MIEAIRAIVKSMIKPDILLGEVKNFNAENWTITVLLNNGATVEEVSIKSVINTESTGVYIEPAVGSIVLCGMTDGKIENLKVLIFSEIKNVRIIPSEELILRGDDFGGLVKLQELKNNLDALKNYVEALKTAVSTGLTSVGESSAASGSAGKGAFELAMTGQAINFSDMENKKVKHG